MRPVPIDGRRQVHAAAIAEALDRLAVRRVEREQVVAVGEEKAPVLALLPPHQPPLGVAGKPQIGAPDLLAGRRVQGECVELRRQPVEHPVDDQGARVHRGAGAPGLAGIVHPGDFELTDVVPVDLGQRAVVPAARVAEIDGPVLIRWTAADDQERHQEGARRGSRPVERIAWRAIVLCLPSVRILSAGLYPERYKTPTLKGSAR